MSIYSDKLVQVQVVINYPYFVAQMCTYEDCVRRQSRLMSFQTMHIFYSMPCLAGGGGPSLSLGPAGDSSCELAPLINSGKSQFSATSSKNQFSTTSSKKASTFDGHQKSSRNPRLGETLRTILEL